jgi:hypothetical protein
MEIQTRDEYENHLGRMMNIYPVGSFFFGDTYINEDLLFVDYNRQARKRLGRRLFALADLHFPEADSQLLRAWARRERADTSTMRLLRWAIPELRRLMDRDVVCQLILSTLQE